MAGLSTGGVLPTVSTSSTAPIASATPSFAFTNVPTMYTCGQSVVTWDWTSTDDANLHATVDILITDSGLVQSAAPSNTLSQPTQTTTASVSSTSLPTINTVLAQDLDAATETWTWEKTNVTQGWYILQAYVSSIDTLVASSNFFIFNGTDTSCFDGTGSSSSASSSSSAAASSTPAATSGSLTSTSTSTSTAVAAISPSASSHAGAIAGGVIGGLAFLVAVLGSLIFCFLRRRRQPTRARARAQSDLSSRRIHGSPGGGGGGAIAFGGAWDALTSLPNRNRHGRKRSRKVSEGKHESSSAEGLAVKAGPPAYGFGMPADAYAVGADGMGMGMEGSGNAHAQGRGTNAGQGHNSSFSQSQSGDSHTVVDIGRMGSFGGGGKGGNDNGNGGCISAPGDSDEDLFAEKLELGDSVHPDVLPLHPPLPYAAANPHVFSSSTTAPQIPPLALGSMSTRNSSTSSVFRSSQQRALSNPSPPMWTPNGTPRESVQSIDSVMAARLVRPASLSVSHASAPSSPHGHSFFSGGSDSHQHQSQAQRRRQSAEVIPLERSGSSATRKGARKPVPKYDSREFQEMDAYDGIVGSGESTESVPHQAGMPTLQHQSSFGNLKPMNNVLIPDMPPSSMR
ncbi:uncharacterized protein STEHIDRAFT_161295 [Stereum hirsutum FP-91666 SS1]|uniref:uncharacterized protein n=1 Tax=Stereum hirsutum (strain FP-91666) TaxID=721885 RepID=UPI000444992B|nr:uncharacterized protein STEHIDRAFT_161295 [Stereum hirsutum FP-91666 SS1]EIM81941.1 hypothetical protein STEHIDRAFT_161295 [Stereum hirsutum FP-91666 SS1]